MTQLINYSLFGLYLLCASAVSSQETDNTSCSSEKHHQFDFWIGDWRVTDNTGKLLGHNTIEKQLNGCLLMEHWRGTGGSNGKSLNFYDSRLKQWHQT